MKKQKEFTRSLSNRQLRQTRDTESQFCNQSGKALVRLAIGLPLPKKPIWKHVNAYVNAKGESETSVYVSNEGK